MAKRARKTEQPEPIGIVISGGTATEPVPRLSAYVYSVEDERSGEPLDGLAA